MRKGVERDIERQQRKAENIRLLEEQRTLTQNLENRER